MSVFVIAYDLRKPDFDYQPLYEALGTIGAAHIQDSVWGLRTDSTSVTVFDYLWQHMHSAKDRLFVIPFDNSRDYKSINAMTRLKDL